jgi:hypothetical protein
MNLRSIGYTAMAFVAVAYSGGANAAEPVSIAAINARTGVVTARDAKTKSTVEFTVVGAALLKSLKIGQTVYADYGTQKVSVDGISPCCGIVRIQSAEPPSNR